jgi:acyl homoserine lactone synthase
MQIKGIRGAELSPSDRMAIAGYRYGIFVESLKWQLPCEVGNEADEYDIPSAMHLVVRGDGGIVGYARLLPTTGEYLLEKHFPHLLNGAAAPKSAEVLELSRFAAGNNWQSEFDGSNELRTLAGKLVLLGAIQYAQECGAKRLIFCTTVGIERLAKRWGVDIRRIGPPVLSHGGLLVGATIECNERSVTALLDGGTARDRTNVCQAISEWGRALPLISDCVS